MNLVISVEYKRPNSGLLYFSRIKNISHNEIDRKEFEMKNLISKTGWTKEDWKDHILASIGGILVLGAGFIFPGLIG